MQHFINKLRYVYVEPLSMTNIFEEVPALIFWVIRFKEYY